MGGVAASIRDLDGPDPAFRVVVRAGVVSSGVVVRAARSARRVRRGRGRSAIRGVGLLLKLRAGGPNAPATYAAARSRFFG